MNTKVPKHSRKQSTIPSILLKGTSSSRHWTVDDSRGQQTTAHVEREAAKERVRARIELQKR